MEPTEKKDGEGDQIHVGGEGLATKRPQTQDGEGGEAVKKTKVEGTMNSHLRHIPWRYLTKKVLEACVSVGKAKDPKGPAAQLIPLIWNHELFEKMVPECAPVKLTNAKVLASTTPWLKCTFGYKPTERGGKWSNSFRLEFGSKCYNDNEMKDFKEHLAMRDEVIMKKAYDCRGKWGARWEDMIKTKMPDPEEDGAQKNVDKAELKHVKSVWKNSIKSDMKTTYADGINFNLKTVYKNEALGIPEDCKTSAFVYVWDNDGELLTNYMTLQNSCGYTGEDAAECYITNQHYGIAAYQVNHINVTSKDAGITYTLEEVKVALPEEIFPAEQQPLCTI